MHRDLSWLLRASSTRRHASRPLDTKLAPRKHQDSGFRVPSNERSLLQILIRCLHYGYRIFEVIRALGSVVGVRAFQTYADTYMHMGVSVNRGPQFSTLNSRIIRTPK